VEVLARILAEQLSQSLREKAKHYFREVAKRIAMIVIGLLFLVTGLFYVMLGIVKAIALYIPEWGAFGLVGVIIIIIGYFTLKRAAR